MHVGPRAAGATRRAGAAARLPSGQSTTRPGASRHRREAPAPARRRGRPGRGERHRFSPGRRQPVFGRLLNEQSFIQWPRDIAVLALAAVVGPALGCVASTAGEHNGTARAGTVIATNRRRSALPASARVAGGSVRTCAAPSRTRHAVSPTALAARMQVGVAQLPDPPPVLSHSLHREPSRIFRSMSSSPRIRRASGSLWTRQSKRRFVGTLRPPRALGTM